VVLTADEIDIIDIGGKITATEIDAALVENRTAIDLNTAKDTNATHTGEVTGDVALTLDNTAISGKTLVTAVSTDYVIIGDTSDANNLKKALISDFASAGGNMSTGTYDLDVDGKVDVAENITADTASGVVVKLGDAVGGTVFDVQDSGGISQFKLDSDGGLTQSARANPTSYFNSTVLDYWFGIDDATGFIEIRTSTTPGTGVLWYVDRSNGDIDAVGDMNIASAKVYKIAGVQIDIADLGAGGNWTPTGTLNLESATTTLGTIGTGVWQGTAITDTYVADTLTIAGGTVNNTVIGGSTPAAISGTSGTFSGALTGLLENSTDADAHILTSAEYHGGTVLATGAGIYTLPTASAGRSGCVETGQGVTAIIQLLPVTGDFIVHEGARGTAATSIKSGGSAGDRICYRTYNGDDWYVSTFGTWAE